MKADSFGEGHGEHRQRHQLSRESAAMLVAARKRRGWSLRQAAGWLGISFGYLGMLEAAQRAPSRVTAELLIEAYELSEVDAALLRVESVTGVGRDYRRARS